jgi:lipopolysaccharide transport system ATP-binding protein
MSEAPAFPVVPAVRLASVSKVYRLYQKPLYRFLDLFDLCAPNRGFYTEHQALDHVDFEVGRGEKVAVIGRNGAGKSTMLKVITGLLRPTSGSVQVNGRISNLLQIGSGFHPDFTGRQNVFAGLAHQGVVGRAAANLFDEIVGFAEVEEYIDQPMKTYSTGMCSRLMFSSAIIMTPDILIVDEILGVGDAYFAHKSFERMRELCVREGTTLLLVTHDIYSALNLCDRFMWLDRGRVLFDGDGNSAVSLYQSSIKAQEEEWLRRQNAAKFPASAPQQRTEQRVHVLIRSRTGFVLASPLALAAIELTMSDRSHTMLSVGRGADGWNLLPESSLGPPEQIAGRAARVLRASGTIYHKAEWVVTLPGSGTVDRVRVGWHYTGSELVDILVFTPDRRVAVAAELAAADGWQEATFDRGDGPAQSLGPQRQIDYGTGSVRIVSVKFLDELQQEVVQARFGDPLTIRITARIEPQLVDRHVTLILGFWRQGSAYIGSVHEPNRLLPDSDECIIDVRLDPLRFGSGQWFLNVGIGAPGLYERPVMKYFATDDAWYHLLAGWIQLQVTSIGSVDAVGCFVVHPATISCVPAGERVASR